MKTTVAFCLNLLFSIQSLVPNQSLNVLLQSAEIYEHYQEHLLESQGQMGFVAFLVAHYSPDSTHKQHPNHGHNHLPKFDATTGVHSFLPTPHYYLCTSESLLMFTPASTSSFWNNLYHFSFPQSLLNPPRFVA